MAVVREDTVRINFDVDDKELRSAETAVDDLVENVKKMGGNGGAAEKAEDGLNEATRAAKKFGGVDMGKLSDGIDKVTNAAGRAALALGKMAVKGLAVGAGAAAAGIAALGTQAVKSYAEYEQLVGGVETLFGNGGMNIHEYAKSVGKSAEKCVAEYTALNRAQSAVMKNANDAFKTTGLSANEYMQNVTSFSASLISSLGGDTEEAAKVAHTAMVAMSDNSNKMGSDMGSIQNAFQGLKLAA